MDQSVPIRVRTARTFVTREGWYWLLGAVLLLVIGWFKAINLLMFLGYPMVVLWIVNLILVRRRVRWVEVWRRQHEPVFAGQSFTLEFEVRNPGRRRQIGLRLEDQGPNHRLSHFFATLRAGDKQRVRQACTLPQRGWYTPELCQLATGYPFGLAEHQVQLSADRALLVYPALGTLHRSRLRRFLAVATPYVGRSRQRPVHHPAAQSDFHGLRPFRAGDSPRWIHWRTSARRGELMVREFEEEPSEHLVLVLEPFVPAEPSPAPAAPVPGQVQPPPRTTDVLERAISMTATICWEWCRSKGHRLLLAVAGTDPVVVDGITGPEHAELLLECLAVQTGSTNPDGTRLVDRLLALSLPRAPVLVVSTRPSTLPDALSRALARPVASVDVSASQTPDFFEGPARWNGLSSPARPARVAPSS
jgi:uncharacterized protein (DUF58 family)